MQVSSSKRRKSLTIKFSGTPSSLVMAANRLKEFSFDPGNSFELGCVWYECKILNYLLFIFKTIIYTQEKHFRACGAYNKESGFLTSSIDLVFYFCTGFKNDLEGVVGIILSA